MGATLERLFFKFYPTTKKETENPEGEWMRCMALVATVVH